MPITLLDGILVGFTLVSAMLAMVRGFSREVLSIASWVAAAAAIQEAIDRISRDRPRTMASIAETRVKPTRIPSSSVIGIEAPFTCRRPGLPARS